MWAEAVPPGGVEGGLSWGVVVDSRAVYYTALNSGSAKFTLLNGTTIMVSALGAVSLKDGSTFWQTAAPRNSHSVVAPVVVNNVILTGLGDAENDTLGSFLASNECTGKISCATPTA